MPKDNLLDIALAIDQIARAIKPHGTGGRDAYGATVDSLSDSVMGVTDGLKDVADAIRSHESDV